MKKTKGFLLLLAAALFLSGCKPTPVTPPVEGKYNDIIKMVRSATAEEIQNGRKTVRDQINSLGGHLKTQMKPNPKVTINVDADIALPGSEAFPVVRIKTANFSKELFMKYTNNITEGQQLYNVYFTKDEVGNLYYQDYTKEELSAIIMRIKGQLANKDLTDSVKNGWSDIIKELENQSESAVCRADEKPYEGTFIEGVDENVHETMVRLKCYMGKDTAAQFMMIQTQSGDGSMIAFGNCGYGCGYSFEHYQGKAAKNIKMTYEEAKAKAEDFVRAADGENSSLKIYGSDIGYETSLLADYSKETSPQAYEFIFARSYNGVIVKPVRFLGGKNETTQYRQQVHPEELSVIVDDEGVKSSYWVNYAEYIETVSKDVPLLDFNTVKEKFEKHCSQEFSWVPINNPDSAASLNIKSIEFNLMAIPEKDNPGVFITVPVWDFMGYEEGDEAPGDTVGNTREDSDNISILTINAIDGSIINRELGY